MGFLDNIGMAAGSVVKEVKKRQRKQAKLEKPFKEAREEAFRKQRLKEEKKLGIRQAKAKYKTGKGIGGIDLSGTGFIDDRPRMRKRKMKDDFGLF